MSNFTPGKWGVHPAGGIYADQEPALGESLERRVEVWLDEYTEEHKANARLVAAAPEMEKRLDQASFLLHGASTLDWVGAECSKSIADRIDVLLRRINGEEEAK